MNKDLQNQPDLYDGTVPATDMLESRKIALSILDQTLNRNQALDQVLERDNGFRALSTRDRAFVRMLVATTLRRTGQIDKCIMPMMDRPLNELHPPILMNIMRLGATQLLFMDVAQHAAVNTSVQLAENHGASKQKGFVNAILRRITREGRDRLTQNTQEADNIPDWLRESWIKAYGNDMAEQIIHASLKEAPLDISVKDPHELSHWEYPLRGRILPTGTLRCNPDGPIQTLPGFADGKWWVQDFAASLPVKLIPDLKGKTVVDLCAAPGGKTMQLAAQGANVIAVDRSANRMKLLEDNLERLKLSAKLEISDGAEWQPKEPVDAVLLDAPCSATGTIRRHPDLLYHKSPEDIARLCELQQKLLRNALKMLKPGGVLVYCTCSLQPEEGQQQIETLLQQTKTVSRMAVNSNDLNNFDLPITEQGDIRTLPFYLSEYGGMDGFYICRLKKT